MADTTHSQSNPLLSTFGLDWQVLLFNIISFLIVIYVLKRFVFEPVMKIVNEREALINEGLQNTENSKKVVENAESEAKEIIKNAQREANSILENVEKQEERVRQEQQAKTQEYIDQMMEKGISDVESMKVEAKQALAKEAKEIILDATQKILKREVDPSVVTRELDQKLSPIK